MSTLFLTGQGRVFRRPHFVMLAQLVKPTPKPCGRPWAPAKCLAEFLGRRRALPIPHYHTDWGSLQPRIAHVCAHGFCAH